MSLQQTLGNMALSPMVAFERIVRQSQFRPKLQDARSILVLEYMLPLGCCVHLTPLYEAIRAVRPEATITVATRGIGLELLRHNPSIDSLIETPDPLRAVLPAAKKLTSELNRLQVRPDCVVTGASDQRTRIGLMGMLATGGWRVGFTQTPALYHQPLTFDRKISLIENNLRVAALVGCTHGTTEPRVYFSPQDVRHATALFQDTQATGRPRLVMVTQTSGGQRTGWHRERFARTIEHAHREHGCAVLYVGTAADAASIEEIRAAAGGIGASLAGRTTVTQLAAVLAMSDFVISLDTGTMHVARAVGTPMVVLGPSWQKPVEWMPLGLPHVRILRGPDRDTVPADYRLDEIEAEDVIRGFDDLTTRRWLSREDRIRNSVSKTDHAARDQAGQSSRRLVKNSGNEIAAASAP